MKSLREQILAASLRLIREAGLTGLSMREVARRAGVSHQAPYHYFEDKQAIVAALVERAYVALAERVEAAAATPGTPRERLSRTGQAYVRFALDRSVEFRLMFRPELVDPARYPAVQAAGARAYAVLSQLVAELPGQVRCSPDAAEVAVSLHWSLVHGLATLLVDGALGRRFKSRKQRDEHVERVLELFELGY